MPDQPRAYRAWVFKIVRNAALDELRSRALRRQEQPEAAVDLWRYDDAYIAKITVEQGMAAIAPAHREIIALIDIGGFSYAETAEVLDIPVGTVMSRLARGRERLRTLMDYGGGDRDSRAALRRVK